MRRLSGAFVILSFLICTAAPHPGNGIVVLPNGSVITGDAVRNGIWKFSPGRAPERIVSSFHCHWVVAGRDGKVYAETVAERNGTWTSTHFRLNIAGGAPTKLGQSVSGDASRFTVDSSGARIFHQDGKFLRVTATGSSPFRGGGTLVNGEQPVGSIAALAWGPQDNLYFAEETKVRVLDPSGKIRTVITLKGRVTSTLMGSRSGGRRIWGMDVSPSGDIYIADASTGQVLRTRDGRETVVTREKDGWMATGVAVSGSNVYVLETKLVGNRSLGPRVRRINPDGTALTLGTVVD